MAHGRGQRAFDRPAGIEAALNRAVLETESSRPCRNAEAFAAKVQKHIISFVVTLREAVGPLAIVLCVWAVIVSAFDRQSWRAWAHIIVERLKACAPFRRHRDSSAAVAWELLTARVITAFANVLPNPMFCGATSSMYPMAIVPCLAFQATTTPRVACSQVGSRQSFGLPTFASTDPRSIFQGLTRCVAQPSRAFSDHGQASEHCANQIEHGPFYPVFSRDWRW